MFKRGNIVKTKCNFWGESDPEMTGKLAVVSRIDNWTGGIYDYILIFIDNGYIESW